jgi:hypothetical protein
MVFVPVRQARNRFLGSLKGVKIRALAGRYYNPIPTRFLALIDYFKIPAQLISNGERFEPAFVERNKKQSP